MRKGSSVRPFAESVIFCACFSDNLIFIGGNGLRQLSYMKELGMGCDRYVILDMDHGDTPITLAEAVKNVKPFKA